MLNRDDITRAAQLLIDNHRDHALAAAQSRIRALEFRGERETARTWTEVADAIRELTHTESDAWSPAMAMAV
jgi:hypothetical protein